MPWEIVHWLRVKVASDSVSGRYLVWGKTQYNPCTSLVPRFCQREPKVPHHFGGSFLHQMEKVHESFGLLACERHMTLWTWQKQLNVARTAFTYWELVPAHSCTVLSDLRSPGIADLAKHAPGPPKPGQNFLHLSAESTCNFFFLAYWKLYHFCLEFRVIFHGETTSHLFPRRRHTFKWSSNSCCQSQMRIDVRPEPVCFALPRSLPTSSKREGLVILCRVRPIGFSLYMSKHVQRTDRKAFHSSHMQHLRIPLTRPCSYQCEMED